MAAEDELAFPQVPEAKPEDPEDVSWALSTAEAMWARGDHLEGIKWIRKAAEAASDAEDDSRALELAKSASDLTTLLARRSRASIPDGPGLAGGAPHDFRPPPPSVQPLSGQQLHGHPNSGLPLSGQRSSPKSVPPPMSGIPISVGPQTSRMGNAPPLPPSAPLARPSSAPAAPSGPPAPLAPVAAAPAAPAAPAKAPVAKPGRSVPPGPIPLPSRASSPPKAPQPAPARNAPRPLATSDARQGPQPGRGVLSNRNATELPAKGAKGRRKSRENLDAEAQAAGLLESPPQGNDGPTVEHALGSTDENEVPPAAAEAVEVPVADARVKRRSGRPAEPEATVVTRLDDLVLAQRQKSADEWDASPTQNLNGDDMDHMSVGDRLTTAFAAPAAAAAAPPPARAPASTVHDPEIQTSQAVRVVVWRDGTGVHVAPAGTVVSSITIDAVLVVLEPSADLTAWLSQRER